MTNKYLKDLQLVHVNSGSVEKWSEEDGLGRRAQVLPYNKKECGDLLSISTTRNKLLLFNEELMYCATQQHIQQQR